MNSSCTNADGWTILRAMESRVIRDSFFGDHTRIHQGDVHIISSDLLPSVKDAAFDPHAEEHNARCHPGTRVALLREVQNWADDPDARCIFWLQGMAGTGKSTVSRTVAQLFADKGVLGASFFFKRGEVDRGNAALFFTTIAAQLAWKEPRMVPIVVVVDALDECDSDQDIKGIVQLLSRAKSLDSIHLRVFITSRPELPIRLGFARIRGEYQDFALHEIPRATIEQDMLAFLTHELERIKDDYRTALPENQLPTEWPGKGIVKTLVDMAVPLFIFAATMCRFIEDDAFMDPMGQLTKILEYRSRTGESELERLDATYLPVLDQLVIGTTGSKRSRLLSGFRDIVGPIVLLGEPLSITSLSQLLDIPEVPVVGRLCSLHSVLRVPPNSKSPIRLFHLSFRDFLIDPDKRDTHEFWVDAVGCHRRLLERCLQTMTDHLRKDICNLRKPATLRADVDALAVEASLPPHIQYACLYWVQHLDQSEVRPIDGDQVHQFLLKHLLHWLEALCLLDVSK
ncbi:hypothetical protein ACJ41O_013911 [Fusarium nematophilum]